MKRGKNKMKFLQKISCDMFLCFLVNPKLSMISYCFFISKKGSLMINMLKLSTNNTYETSQIKKIKLRPLLNSTELNLKNIQLMEPIIKLIK